MKESEVDRKKYDWGEITSREMGELLAIIREQKVVIPLAIEKHID